MIASSSGYRRSQLIAGSPRRPAVIRPDGTTEEFSFYYDFAPGERVLDVGCGPGIHLRQLLMQGCDAIGIDVDPAIINQLKMDGLPAVLGVAEALPFPAATFDGVISCVAIPYTDERAAIGEWARVLKPGGQVRAAYHGIAFALESLLQRSSWKHRMYGGRQLFNTWFYQLSGRRLPGFLGDALCQSSRYLRRYYQQFELELVDEFTHPGIGGFSRFIYHRLRKL